MLLTMPICASCGWAAEKEDPSHFKDLRNFSDFLTQHGILYTLRETEGAHTWIVWRQYLHEVAPQLFQ